MLEALELPLLRVLGPEVAPGLRRPAPRARRRPAHRRQRSTASTPTATARRLRLGDGSAPSTADLRRGRHRRRARHRARRGRRAHRRQRHPRRRAPAHRRPATSTPPATSPTPTTRVLGRPRAGRALGQRHPAGQVAGAQHAGRGGDLRRGCRTSSPTSTTSAWSTSAHVGPDGYDEVVAPRRRGPACSPRSGCATAGWWPACTPTTGTPSTRSGRSSAPSGWWTPCGTWPSPWIRSARLGAGRLSDSRRRGVRNGVRAVGRRRRVTGCWRRAGSVRRGHGRCVRHRVR